MLQLTQNGISESIIVTLNEKKTIDEPYFIFSFTHVTTNRNMEFSVRYNDDISPFPTRYNEFDISTTQLFQSHEAGQWHYEIYENSTATLTGANLLENGKMYLNLSSPTTFTGYQPTTTYKGYAG